ncbi:MAG: substrate-binding domain-containing protein, partial [bacterium]|nr:substrate-binding domain-containing protein [bacterium]
AVREIGIAFYDVFSITNTYLAKILNGISEVASETGFSLSIFTFKGRSIYQGNDLLRESLERRSISGLLLLSRMAEKDIRTLMEVGCPIVAVDNEYVNLDIPTVLTDDHQMAYCMTEQLVRGGHKVGMVLGRWKEPQSHIVDRLERMSDGYRAALAAAGCDYDYRVLKSREQMEGGIEDITAALDNVLNEVTSLIVDGDWLAEEVHKYLTAHGRTVGKDIELCVYSDNLELPFAQTVYKPLREMGRQAVRKLIDQINEVPFTVKEILPTESKNCY